MEHGDEAAMIFLLKTYSRKEMINVLKRADLFQGDQEISGEYFSTLKVEHGLQSDIRLLMGFTPATEFHSRDEMF